MKGLLLVILAAVIVAVNCRRPRYTWHEEIEFYKFKIEYKKHYDWWEEPYRKLIFVTNLRDIEEHNKLYKAGESSYKKAVNQFADLLPEEVPKGFLNPYIEAKKKRHEAEFRDFKLKFNKFYDGPTEAKFRKLIFMYNLNRIEEHNKKYEAGETSWTMGVNQFTDMLPPEM